MKKTIVDYFEATVEKYPLQVAVADPAKKLTYEELQSLARKVGTSLAKRNIEKKPVAILMRRSVDLPAAMLSVLYSGNFYVVLDAESPVTRLQKILKTLCPAAVLYEQELDEIVQTFDTAVEKVRWEEVVEKQESDETLLRKIRTKMTSEDPAYALFTSGSTGEPKGALLTHLNVISYMRWFIPCFEINHGTVFGSQTPLHFSMSVSDFYATIFTGASYHIIPKEYFAFPAKLIGYMNERKVNVIYWVPSAYGIVAKFDVLKYMLPETLEKALFAGEVMPVKYLNYWRSYLQDVQYANLFGPTETTDICTYYVVDRTFDEQETLPIGKACDNCELIVVDEEGKAVTDDSIGELYVKSPFVGKGYYRNKENTDKAFVQNPLHNNYLDTVYKTGDLVKKNEQGELQYIGRKDFQIKHQGYRIEPGEIENVFNTVDDVELTVCVYDQEKDELLLAYESNQDLDEKLRAYGEKTLPYYMQPSVYRMFQSFPKNANGKIDRKMITKMITENR